MAIHLVCVQGAGEGAYEEDAELVQRLHQALGDGFAVVYPRMPDEGNAPYERWKAQIDQHLAATSGEVILVGHSVGGSVLLKFLAEADPDERILGAFLLATPLWGGNGWRYDGYEELELPPNAADRLAAGPPVFMYHCRDDEVVPFAHLGLFAKILPAVTTRALDTGGHQGATDLAPIVADIRRLQPADTAR